MATSGPLHALKDCEGGLPADNPAFWATFDVDLVSDTTDMYETEWSGTVGREFSHRDSVDCRAIY